MIEPNIAKARQKLLAVWHRLLECAPPAFPMKLYATKNFPPRVATRLNQLLTKSMTQCQGTLKTQEFWWVVDTTQSEKNIFLYETASGLLWDGKPLNTYERTYTVTEAKEELSARQLQFSWRLPSLDQLLRFATKLSNPLRKGKNNRLVEIDAWLTDQGQIDLDIASPTPNSNAPGCIITCADTVTSKAFIELALHNGWLIKATKGQSKDDLLAPMKQSHLAELYTDSDYRACRLPKLEAAQFTDPNKGLWELWGISQEILSEQSIRARNPADDVKDWNIAIDFGTSSTVVAYDNNGQHELLRIGVQDFLEAPKPEHYENPTVLEFIDFQNMLRAWQAEAYRPDVSWDDVRCSHEALHNLRNNETNPVVVSSILGKIKQWALRQGMDRTLRIIDQRQQFEHEFAPLSARMPVKGKMLEVSADFPFDPVELYAWFLGMHINWRGRGLFLRYYMTFPIAYPREVKENILSAFRRGLQRALPATLVEQPVFSKFSVEELASEPAAYAAAALPKLNLEPSTEGLAYAVFDFGGGTADFDFGYYRLPTPEEEDSGCEVVFVHFGTEGDRYLGGENLLDNMAYLTFLHNLEICRKHRVAFNKPLDAADFPGSELFLEHTQAAATNTLMLVARLRPLWEKGSLSNSSGIEKIDLINRDGEKVTCELAISVDALLQYLEQRIEIGIQNFFVAMKRAFADKPPSEIHVLLAGNSSRSNLVTNFFGLRPSPENIEEDETTHHPLFARTRAYLDKLFGEVSPGITVYPPLPVDENNLYRPTGKTGVALGLLRLCPGGVVDVINHASRSSGDQAPFAHYVGRVRQSKFQPALRPGMPYNEWHEVGPPRDRVFNLFHTQTPKANTGEMEEGESGLFKKRLDLSGDKGGKRLFIQAVAPNCIEYCTAGSLEEIKRGEFENLMRLEMA